MILMKISAFNGHDGKGVVGGVGGIEFDHDIGGFWRVENEAGVVGGDGQFVEASIDEDGQFDAGRPAMIEEFVKRRFDGAAGKQHVVNQHDGRTGDVDGDQRRCEFLGDRVATDVVTMKRDIEGAGTDGESGTESRDAFGETVGQRDSAGGDTEEENVPLGAVALGDGFGQPVDGGVDFGGGDTLRCRHEGCLCRSCEVRTSGKSVWYVS